MDTELRQKIEALLERHQRLADTLQHCQANSRGAINLVKAYIPVIVEYEARLRDIQAELKGLGFHDTGHAKGELTKNQQVESSH